MKPNFGQKSKRVTTHTVNFRVSAVDPRELLKLETVTRKLFTSKDSDVEKFVVDDTRVTLSRSQVGSDSFYTMVVKTGTTRLLYTKFYFEHAGEDTGTLSFTDPVLSRKYGQHNSPTSAPVLSLTSPDDQEPEVLKKLLYNLKELGARNRKLPVINTEMFRARESDVTGNKQIALSGDLLVGPMSDTPEKMFYMQASFLWTLWELLTASVPARDEENKLVRYSVDEALDLVVKPEYSTGLVGKDHMVALSIGYRQGKGNRVVSSIRYAVPMYNHYRNHGFPKSDSDKDWLRSSGVSPEVLLSNWSKLGMTMGFNGTGVIEKLTRTLLDSKPAFSTSTATEMCEFENIQTREKVDAVRHASEINSHIVFLSNIILKLEPLKDISGLEQVDKVPRRSDSDRRIAAQLDVLRSVYDDSRTKNFTALKLRRAYISAFKETEFSAFFRTEKGATQQLNKLLGYGHLYHSTEFRIPKYLIARQQALKIACLLPPSVSTLAEARSLPLKEGNKVLEEMHCRNDFIISGVYALMKFSKAPYIPSVKSVGRPKALGAWDDGR